MRLCGRCLSMAGVGAERRDLTPSLTTSTLDHSRSTTSDAVSGPLLLPTSLCVFCFVIETGSAMWPQTPPHRLARQAHPPELAEAVPLVTVPLEVKVQHGFCPLCTLSHVWPLSVIITTHINNPWSPFSMAHMYVCLGLTPRDWAIFLVRMDSPLSSPWLPVALLLLAWPCEMSAVHAAMLTGTVTVHLV